MRLSKKRRKLLLKAVYILASVLFIALWYFFFTYKGLYVTHITVDNTMYQERIETYTKEVLSGKSGYIFPAQHTAFLPKGRIEKNLLLLYPEIQSLIISRSGLTGMDIFITLRTPAFRMENGLALDVNGIAYKEPGDISILPLFTLTSTFPTKEQAGSMQNFMSKLSVRLAPVTEVKIDENKDVQYFFGNTKQYVITPLLGDTSIYWSTLVSALDTEPLSTLLQTKRNELEYIDLRFGNKVFYKFAKGTAKQTSTTTPLQ